MCRRICTQAAILAADIVSYNVSREAMSAHSPSGRLAHCGQLGFGALDSMKNSRTTCWNLTVMSSFCW
jgi:hypothetical protein